MTHGHPAGQQNVTGKRRRQRQLMRLIAIVLGITIVAVAAILIVANDEDSSPPSVAQLPTPSGEATWTTNAFTGGPRLAVDRTVHDQGMIPYGQEVQAAFRLRNVGDEALTIDAMSVNILEGC